MHVVLFDDFLLLLILPFSYVRILLLVKLMQHILVYLLHWSLNRYLLGHLSYLILVQHRL
jgi:hypothetical protein